MTTSHLKTAVEPTPSLWFIVGKLVLRKYFFSKLVGFILSGINRGKACKAACLRESVINPIPIAVLEMSKNLELKALFSNFVFLNFVKIMFS
jgi:hypothetical protein